MHCVQCLNASPALLAGVLTRFVVLRGGYLPLPGAGNLPAFLPMSLCLHLSLSTEYFLTDCLLLLLVGKHCTLYDTMTLLATVCVCQSIMQHVMFGTYILCRSRCWSIYCCSYSVNFCH